MLLQLRLIKKQYYTCLVNYKPQVNLAWVPLETAFEIQKMKSNYLLLFIHFCSLSSPTISNCFLLFSLDPHQFAINSSQR